MGRQVDSVIMTNVSTLFFIGFVRSPWGAGSGWSSRTKSKYIFLNENVSVCLFLFFNYGNTRWSGRGYF